jgi:PilZ domain/GYF domain 2
VLEKEEFMKYLISHQNQESGPFTLDEIVGKVRSKELELFDYIFDDAKQDWVLLMEHPDLAQKLKSNKPPRPPQTVDKTGTGTTTTTVTPVQAATTPLDLPPAVPVKAGGTPDAHTISEWFVLKGENKFGPFTYTDVVKMLQQKIVFPFDYIWHSGLESWKRVAETGDFTEENIRLLFAKTEGKKKDVFLERQFKRKKFGGRVIIHDNMTLWKGSGFEISKGGVGVTMNNALVVPGQQVFVHFTGEGEFPAFNAVCEVVSKKYVNDDTPIQYGLRFLSLSQEVQDQFYKKVA